jgi:hypothetical protein
MTIAVAIAEFLFNPFFIGFTIWSFIYVWTKQEFLLGYAVESTDRFAARSLILIGLVHVGILFFKEGIAERAFGEYWFGFWIYPITYAVLTQLLWFDAVRKTKIVRLILTVWFFGVIHFEKFVIIVTSFHRDYLSEDESRGHALELTGYVVINLALAFAIFAILVMSGMRFKAWLQKQKG